MADFNENRAVINAANHFDQRYDQLIVDYGVDMSGPKPSKAELDKALHELDVAYDFEDSCREKAIKNTLNSFNPLKNPLTALVSTGVAVTTGGLSIVGSGLSDMAGECIENKYGRMAGQGLASMVSGDVGSNMLTGALETGAALADRAMIDEKVSAKEPDIKAPSAEASYIDQMIKDQDREGAKLNPAALDKLEQEILNSFTPEEKREIYSDYDNGPSM
jgi:hypothetical protein